MEQHFSHNKWLNKFSIEGKVILITGSTRGIGRALAEAFLENGAKVWIHGRDGGICNELGTALGAYSVAADLSKASNVETLCQTVLAKTPEIDCLINNAAMEVPKGVDEIDVSFLDELFQVNLYAPVMLVKHLLPGLKAATPSSVINMTSIHQDVPYARNSVYGMTKSALKLYTKTAAIELARFGIRVNNLAPGAIETDINREIIDQIGRDSFAEWIPSGSVGTTDELVGATLFLASSASSYVTGTTLVVDGGYSQNLVRYWA